MPFDTADIDRRMDRFIQVCRTRGAKLTHQRMEIFREVAQTGEHPDVEKVYSGVRQRIPTVSLDTVYRTLWWLKNLGLITTLGPAREGTRFDANLSPHHHFVCIRCGRIQDFSSSQLDRLKLPDLERSIGFVETTQVEVKGICLECAAAGSTNDSTTQEEE